MPKCVVLGASGAVGRFLLPRLRMAGHEVTAVSRDARRRTDPGLVWQVGDLHGRMPDLPPCDAMLSLGPLDAFSRWFDRTTELAPAHVIAFGSMSIETKAGSSDSDERELVQRLHQAETDLAAAVVARGGALTLLRPTLIYGAGIDRSLTPIARFARRWRVFPRVPGARGLRQPVHAEDLAEACLALLAGASVGVRVYGLGGGERLGFGAMLERVRASLPLRTVPVPVPLAAAGHLAGFARALGMPTLRMAAIERLNRDLVVDHAAAVADFGWAPRDFHPRASDWMAD